MKRFFIGWFVQTIALLIVAHVVPGISVADWQTALIAALVLGLLNVFLRPLLIFFTLPLTLLSLGLFTFIINALLFYAAASIVEGFVVAGFWSALAGSLLFGLMSFFLNILIKPGNRRPQDPSTKDQRYRKVIDVETVRSKDGGK